MTTDRLTADLTALKIDRNAPRSGGGGKWKWAASIAAVVALFGGFVLVYPTVEAKLFKTEVAVTEVSLVSPAQAAVNLSASGYVVPQRASKVGAKVPGKISKLFVREGSVIQAGAPIAELEMADHQASVTASQARALAESARVETLKATVQELDQQVVRERELVEAGALGRATLEDLQARRLGATRAVKAAEAGARAARLETAALQTGVRDRTIHAPISGTIVTKPKEVGESVGPQTGAVAEIADFTSLMVEAEVPESRLHRVELGAPAEIVLDAYPGRRFRGEVAELGKTVNRAKATVIVKVKFIEGSDGVLPNMSSRVNFLSQPLTDAAMKAPPKHMVPAHAVVTRGETPVVFVIENGKVKKVPVTVGTTTGTDVELLSGPPPGTRVVAKPAKTLDHGQGVKELR